MAAMLLHDPTTKKQVKDVLYGLLYGALEDKFKQRLDAIIERNCVLVRSPYKSFMFRDNHYSIGNALPPRPMNRLDPRLHPAMLEYLGDLEKINREEVPYVIGYINQVLNTSNNVADYLTLLPEAVHHPITEMVATCPCHTKTLPADAVSEMKDKNSNSIAMMKNRMMTNLII